ncbi:MAG: 50S ribosomal protein L25 [Pirellulaceae bacterium]
MSEVLHAAIREGLGTRESRRLRLRGHVPAVLYGHGEESLSLAIPHGEVEAIIRHGSKLVSIEGAVTDSAFVKEVQWDPFGLEVLHLDLTRVSAEESVEVVIAVELVGEAPGAKQGGRVDHVTHEVEIRCPAGRIPEKFKIKINALELGQSITVAALELPEDATMLTPLDRVVATCEEVAAEVEDEEAGAATGVEPEVIGRKEDAEEDEG